MEFERPKCPFGVWKSALQQAGVCQHNHTSSSRVLRVGYERTEGRKQSPSCGKSVGYQDKAMLEERQQPAEVRDWVIDDLAVSFRVRTHL